MARTTLLLLSILFLLPTNAAIKKLQVEYLTNPIGLDITAPRFSWQLESAERGVRQTAYQITIRKTRNRQRHECCWKWMSH